MNNPIHFIKPFVLMLFLLQTATNFGQNTAQFQKEFAALDSFLVKFQEYGQFREKAANVAKFEIVELYKSLFMPDVWVYDNYNPKRDDLKAGLIAKPYTGTFKKIDEFGFDVLRYCTKGVNSRIAGINADYSMISTGRVKYVIRREAIIEDFNGKRLTSMEVFEMVVAKDPGNGEYKIYEWKDLEHTISCSNCDESFEKSVNPADDPKTRLKIWTQFDIGLGLGQLTLANPGLESLNRDIYLNLLEDESEISLWNNKQVKSVLQVGGLLEAMFGHRKQFGLAAGFYYNQMKLELGISDFQLQYEFSQFSSVYNRIVTGNDYRENVTINSFSLPVLGRFALRLNDKLKIHAAVGVALNFGTTFKSEIDVTGTYNARQYFKFEGGDTLSYFNESPQDSDLLYYDLAEADRSEDFSSKRQNGFDVGLAESAIGKERFVVPLSFSLQARLGLGYMINSSSEIVFGVQAGMSNIVWESEDMQLLDKTSDKTNTGSILKSLNEMQTTCFGLYAGLRVYLFSKKTN